MGRHEVPGREHLPGHLGIPPLVGIGQGRRPEAPEEKRQAEEGQSDAGRDPPWPGRRIGPDHSGGPGPSGAPGDGAGGPIGVPAGGPGGGADEAVSRNDRMWPAIPSKSPEK